MSGLSLKGIKKVYDGGVVAVNDFNLEIEDKEFIVLVGPSGCGKTTTLRMVAGLEEISEGELYIDGLLVNEVLPKDRDIAMVFQNYALYPHMTVFDNMAFALKLRKLPKDEIRRRVEEAANILDIGHLLDRRPKALSGGQRQRVALGRAIVREPKVFLMDEPLSNLDAKLRVQMRSELGKLHRRLATTFIYVTHDQIEAITMGTRIVVMKDGIIQQVADPTTLYDEPANVFVGGFIGSPQMNFFKATVEEKNGAVCLNIAGSIVKLPENKGKVVKEKGYVGAEIIGGIRPECLYDEPSALTAMPDTIIKAEVDATEMMGAETHLYCKIGEDKIIARVNRRTTAKEGDIVDLALEPQKIQLFDKDTEQAIR